MGNTLLYGKACVSINDKHRQLTYSQSVRTEKPYLTFYSQNIIIAYYFTCKTEFLCGKVKKTPAAIPFINFRSLVTNFHFVSEGCTGANIQTELKRTIFRILKKHSFCQLFHYQNQVTTFKNTFSPAVLVPLLKSSNRISINMALSTANNDFTTDLYQVCM